MKTRIKIEHKGNGDVSYRVQYKPGILSCWKNLSSSGMSASKVRTLHPELKWGTRAFALEHNQAFWENEELERARNLANKTVKVEYMTCPQ